MNKREYSFATGVVLLIGSAIFFVLPAVFSFDAFFPFMFSLALLVVAVGFFFIGLSDKK